MKMKCTYLAFILLMASCGRYEVGGSSSTIGEVRSFTPSALSSSDLTNLQKICQALGSKNTSTLVNSTHIFSSAQTNCGGGNAETGTLVTTRILSVGGNSFFKRQDNGLDFIFPEVDTPSFGIMSRVCGALTSQTGLTNPSRLTSGESQWVSTLGINSADCLPSSGEVCVLFETGSPQDGGSDYVIHTKEWVKFRTNSIEPKLGFYSFRKKITKSFCTQNDFLTYEATLK